MSCADDGALRARLDAERFDHPTDVDQHLSGCAACRQRTAELGRTADRVAPALALLAPPRLPTAADTDAALSRARSLALPPVSAHRSEPVATTTPPPVPVSPEASAPVPLSSAVPLDARRRDRLSSRLRRPLTAAAALALAFSVFGTPAGRSTASEFLAHFRSERFAPVTVDPQDAAALTELSHLGTVSGDLSQLEPERVGSVGVASQRVGFPVVTPDPARLPAGVRRTPEVLVTSARQLRFTFDSEKAQSWLDAHGGRGTALPDKFDGVSLVVSVPAAVALQYTAADGTPGLIVGEARQLEVRTEGGVGFEELRSFLLRLPGLTPGTRAQLAAIGDWRTTLPLPVPAGQVRWTHTTVAGTDALLLGDNTGLGSAVLWQRDGRIYGVGAPATPKVVRDVAASLH